MCEGYLCSKLSWVLASVKAVAGCAKTTFRPRTGQRRPLLLMSLFVFQVFSLCVNTTDFDYLMTRIKFGWEKENFSNYLTVQRTCRLLGKWCMLFAWVVQNWARSVFVLAKPTEKSLYGKWVVQSRYFKKFLPSVILSLQRVGIF